MPELVKWVRDNGAEFIQVNHPRGSQSVGYAYNSGDDIEALDTKKWTPDFRPLRSSMASEISARSWRTGGVF